MGSQLNRLEHRWGERFPVDIPVQVALPSVSAIAGRLRNLSLSGALMQIESGLRVNSLIQIRVSLPAPLNREALLEAHVSRSCGDEVGIEWCAFGPRAVRALLASPSMRSSSL